MVTFDLVYADHDREDIGILLDYEFDLAFGIDENDFEITMAITDRVLKAGYYVYIEGTEFGGIVDGIKVDTAASKIIYHGVTWHGLLEQRVICPNNPKVDTHYIVAPPESPIEANVALNALLTKLGLTGLFKVKTGAQGIYNSGITVSGQYRYKTAYTAIRELLKGSAARLAMEYKNGFVVISTLPITDYSQDEEFDSAHVDFVIEQSYRPTNHLICLGKGELTLRVVVNLYANAQGVISEIPTFTGMDLVQEVYDYSSSENAKSLEADGRKKLAELWNADKLSVRLDGEGYAIGDIVGAYDDITGLEIKQTVNKKIVKIDGSTVTVEHQVGEL